MLVKEISSYNSDSYPERGLGYYMSRGVWGTICMTYIYYSHTWEEFGVLYV